LRYAIISDIHSNLEALQAVLDDIEQEQVDQVVCLGDVVGYGPNPNECLELVRQHSEIIITGNHDFACIETSELYYFNKYAKEAIEWTLTVITNENLQYLSDLPFDAKIDDYYLVHSNPLDPQSWDYILSRDDARSNFPEFEEQICFIGHSHHPIIYIEDQDGGDLTSSRDNRIQIEEGRRYIINVGSVGQPRDGNPDAAYGIIDTMNQHYELKRVSYNVHQTYQKMIAVHLPQFLADRLLIGR